MQIPVTVTRQETGKVLIQWIPERVALPVEISWSHESYEDGGDWRFLLTVDGDSRVTIDDPSPLARSYFKVTSPAGSVVAAERRLPLDGSANFRDLGGYLTADGRSVRWGQLYRSSDLSRLTEADQGYLHNLGLKVICDLRSNFEAKQAPNQPLDGAMVMKLPIGEGEVPMDQIYLAVGRGDFSAIDPHILERAYQGYIRESTSVYAEMLGRFSQAAYRPALVHCTAGKDRTGLAAAIMLWILGVPTTTIFHDYMLTNDYNAQSNERMLGMLRQHIASTKGVRAESIDLAPMDYLVSARRAYLQTALDTILADFGSIEGYIRQGLGMSAAEQAQLQEVLLIGPPGHINNGQRQIK